MVSSPHKKDLFRDELASSYFFYETDRQCAPGPEQVFTLFHFKSLLKVSISPPQPHAFGRTLFERSHLLTLVEGMRAVATLSPEDVITLQLEQFKLSGERADDIWYDLLGILKVQGPALDLVVLEKLAALLEVTDLLHRAFVDAGLQEE